MRVLVALLAPVLYAQSLGFPGPGTTASIPSGIVLVSNTAQSGTANGVTTSAINTTGANLCSVYTIQFTALGTLSDSKSNTWTKLNTTSIGASTVSAIYYCSNPTVGSGHTFSTAGTASFPAIAVACFSGVKTSSPFDQQTAGAQASSMTSIQPGSVTPTENAELIITGLGDTTGISTATISVNSGFTITDKTPFVTSNSFGASMAYFVQTTAAAINPTWSWTSNNSVGSSIATFKKQ